MNPSIGKTTDGHSVNIDLPRLMRSKLLLQSNSGGGKSYILRRILEQTHGKVQQIMIDTEGEFLTLREKFDYVYCAPQGGDAVATPSTATLLARRLRETRVSAIIDIYELPLPQRQRFVRLFIEEFMAAPKKHWHPCLIALDEAQDYCPESGKGEAESKAAVIDIQARGRKRGLCTILATQRLAKLSKDAAAECQNKLIGLTTLPDDQDSAAKEIGMKPKDAIQILRNLAPGHFFAYGPALSKTVVEIFGGPVQTTHPEVGEKLPPLPAPSEKIRKVLAELADLPKEAEEETRTLEDFRRQNAELKRQLAAATRAQSAIPTLTKEQIAEQQQVRKQLASARALLGDAMKFIVKINAQDFFGKAGTEIDQAAIEKSIKAAVAEVGKQLDKKFDTQRIALETWRKEGDRLLKNVERLLSDGEVPVQVTVRHNEPFTVSPAPKPRPSGGNGATTDWRPGEGERKTLIAVAQSISVGATREQLTVVTGYKRSTRDAYIQRLRNAGFVEVRGDRILITDTGLSELGDDYQLLPTGDALRDYWMARLPEGERKLLATVIDQYPNPVEREALNEHGFARSSRDAYLQRLTARQLIKPSGRSRVIASDILFSQ